MNNVILLSGPLGGLGVISLMVGIPSIMRRYDNYSAEKKHKCLNKDFVTVDGLEKYMLENCDSFCKIRLDTYEHSKKAREVVDKHFKNGYYVSEKYCYSCNELMNMMFISKLNRK